jgi:acetyl-CoA carboxylase carboxyl transferase subunit alpha
MLEHAIYSVISPEGAASILWRDTTKAQDAATNMNPAADLTAFGIIDGIIANRSAAPPRSGRRHASDRRGDASAHRGEDDSETMRRRRRTSRRGRQ